MSDAVGLVKSILVTPRPGGKDRRGSACIVEAMKMENVLRAERDATIKKLTCKEEAILGRRRGHHGIWDERVQPCGVCAPSS